MWVLGTFLLFLLAFHTPSLKSNSMLFWKEFLILKEKASLLPIIFAPSGRLIGRQRGTLTSPVENWLYYRQHLRSLWKLYFPAGYWYTNGHQQCIFFWRMSSFIPSNTISWSKQWYTVLQKPSSSATPFSTSTIYSVLTLHVDLHRRNLPVWNGT